MQTDSQRAAREFLEENYGGITPQLGQILRPAKVKLSKRTFAPAVLGNQLGSIEFEADGGGIAPELDRLTDALLDNAKTIASQTGVPKVFLHFDELDQGLAKLDDRRREMIVGLILAARSVRTDPAKVPLFPVIYVRTDIWEELRFSDKNKISQSSAVFLEWDPDTLLEMVNERIRVKLWSNYNWDELDDGNLMRGSQTKWSHIVSRTFNRPRDVIQFLNHAIKLALKVMPEADLFENSDIQAAREPYSRYLKQELDDEITPHWEEWGEALQACSELSTITFSRDAFHEAYGKRKSKLNTMEADDALELLYSFSVIGYRRGIGGGGSGWVFQYTDPDAGWDNAASRLKVHLGLKEFAKLREERAG